MFQWVARCMQESTSDILSRDRITFPTVGQIVRFKGTLAYSKIALPD
jgi:hypothetical protein